MPEVSQSESGVKYRVILHLDMDAFYASVEQRDHPEWRGLPVIVGADPERRGVVCASSYEARKFGVRSAMPSITAGRLCPQGIFVRPRMDVYRQESHLVFAIVERLAGAFIQQMSVDEAYIDVSHRCQAADADASLRCAIPIAQELKSAIAKERGLTASVGIAGNKLLAKLASDFQKPDGLTLVPELGKAEWLRPLPVRSLHGVGQVTEEALRRGGIVTIADLQDYAGDLRALVGSWASELARFSIGEDDRPLHYGDDVKSISSETTFVKDTDDRPTLRACLREAAAEIAEKLGRYDLEAGTVQVKVRYSDFTTLTRQYSRDEPITAALDIYRIACWLLARERLVRSPLRLLGLGVSHLAEPGPEQLRLPLSPTSDLPRR